MIQIGDKQYRNIQEQVAKNASDIEDIKEEIAAIDPEDSAEKVQAKQLGFAAIIDPRTNINGRLLTSYWADEVEIGGYPAIRVRTNPSSGLRQELTEDRAAAYLEALCGLRYLPKYDLQSPKYHYLIDASGTIYKPQYTSPDEGESYYGLRLFIVPSPYQAKLTAGAGIDITGNVISSTASGGTKLYKHSIWVESEDYSQYYAFDVVSTRSTPFQTFANLNNDFGAGRVISMRTMGQGDAAIISSRNQGAGLYQFYGAMAAFEEYGGTISMQIVINVDTESAIFGNFNETITEL